MLIRHVARHASQLSSSLQPLSVNHGCPFPARRCYAASAANVLRARRTQSILLDDDNPIVHPEKHKLHKAAPPSKKGDHDATLSEEELEWESDPYLNMLSSPIRRCIFSRKTLPNNLLIALKTATYPHDDPEPSSRESYRTPRRLTNVFPRELLHPASAEAKAELPALASDRAYIVCRRTAVMEYIKRDMQIPGSQRPAIKNRVLMFQIDSQLRRRIVQEIQVLLTALSSKTKTPRKSAFPITALESDEQAFHEMIDSSLLPSSFIDKDPPIAILSFHSLQSETSSHFSHLLALPSAASCSPLAPHCTPLYLIPSLFSLPSTDCVSKRTLNELIPPPPDGETMGERWRVSQDVPPEDYRELEMMYPQSYAREIALLDTLRSRFEQSMSLIINLDRDRATAIRASDRSDTEAVGLNNKLVLIRKGSRETLPLLVALWRWRMWVGEAWTGNGWGLKKAAGRDD